MLVGAVSVLSCIGSLRPAGARGFRTAVSAHDREEIAALRRDGLTHYQASRFHAAAQSYEMGYHLSATRHDCPSAGVLGPNWMAVLIADFQYREAMRAYQQVKPMLEACRDAESLAALEINLSALHRRTNNSASALEALRAAGRYPVAPLIRGHALLQVAGLTVQSAGFAAALPYFKQAIDLADQSGNASLAVLGFAQLAHHQLQADDLAGAELSLGQELRWLLVQHASLDAHVLLHLGLLRLGRQDAAGAEQLITRALAGAATNRLPIPQWNFYLYRARCRQQLGHLEEALEDVETGLQDARRWRAAVLPGEETKTSAEAMVQEMYSAAVDIGYELYRRTRRPDLIASTLRAVEENRAVTLRERYGADGGWRDRLSPEYGEVLSQLRHWEAVALNKRDQQHEERVHALRYRLSSLEMSAGLAEPLASLAWESTGIGEVERWQRQLSPDQALLSFSVSSSQSLLWAIWPGGVAVVELPSRHQLLGAVRHFREALVRGDESATPLGRELYSMLFGRLPEPVQRQSEWLLTLDDALFEMPLAALVTGGDSSAPRYLVEDHSLQILPALSLWSPRAEPVRGPFVAIADPIYNQADPRYRRRSSFAIWGQSAPAGLPVARLVATSREAAECARAWPDRPAQVLTGDTATVANLQEALRLRPAVLHFAVHVLQPPGQPEHPLVALSLRENREPDYLTTAEIAAMQVPGSLVVLNGCGSGSGKALPGAGWLGLTRAWMLAGASNVVATYWPTLDEESQLFPAFYTRYSVDKSARPAVALQQAQLALLRSGTWRAAARFWAGYFIVGRG